MHEEEEIHGVGVWILHPLAVDHRGQISHDTMTGTLKLVFPHNLGPGFLPLFPYSHDPGDASSWFRRKSISS